jgi:dienelactone hydrolase
VTLREETVEYRDGEAELSGLITWDDEIDRGRPGVLVVHGGAGLDDHARAQAQRLAQLGLIAFACDMYGREVIGDRARVMACLTELRDDPAKMAKRAGAGIEVIASHPQVNGRLAAVGYCFGGLVVLELARSGAKLEGAISVHGSLTTPRPPREGSIKAKILVCHGALDPFVPPAQLIEFIDEMNSAGADWQLVVYGGAMHGFTHERGAATPGVAYDAVADTRSFGAIRAFMAELFDGVGAWHTGEQYQT